MTNGKVDSHNQRIINNTERLRKYKGGEIQLLKKILKDKKSEHLKRMKMIGKTFNLSGKEA